MNEEPEATPEPEPVEVEIPKTGAEAWKERRALIIERGAAARARGQAERPSNRVAEQRQQNSGREAEQLRAMNGRRTQRRARG